LAVYPERMERATNCAAARQEEHDRADDKHDANDWLLSQGERNRSR